MSLYRHLRLAPLLALGSWFFTTHCSDPLADDCRRTLTCGDQSQGSYTLDPDCIWRNPDGTEWREGPHRIDNEWFWSDGTPVGRSFVCGGGDGIAAGGSGGSGGGGGGAGGDGGTGAADSGVPEPPPPPPTPDCRTNFTCSAPTDCDPDTGVCVNCVNDQSCTESTPRCSEASTCVACLEDADCARTDFARCDLNTNTCQPCTDNAQCGRFENATECNTTINGGTCVRCLEDQQCNALAETPQCKEETGACVQCTANVHCENDRNNSLCNLATNTCVPCVEGTTDCPGEFPICDIDGATARCVACTGNDGPSTCQDPNAANCNLDGDCVPCTASDQCTHLGANRALCDTNLNPNRCVQCITDDDCDSPTASRCVNNSCTECDRANGASVGCGGTQPGGSVCDLSANPNRCVQCLGTDFAACAVAGSPRVCDSVAKTCTNSAPNSAARCGECVSDAHCPVDEVCVQETLGTTSFKFCIPEAAATPPPCAGLGPNRIQETVNSLDATNVSVCSTVSTCPARSDLIAGTVCAVNADCGAPGVDDGICATTAQGLKCNIACGQDADCGDTRTCLIQTPQICSE